MRGSVLLILLTNGLNVDDFKTKVSRIYLNMKVLLFLCSYPKIIRLEFSFVDHFLAFLVLVIFPVLSVKNGKADEYNLQFLPPKKDLYYTNGWYLIIAASLVLTAWNLQNRSWSTFGISWPEINQVVIVSICVLALIYLVDIASTFINPDKLDNEYDDMYFIIPLNWQEYKPYIFLSFAAGVSEEIIYRGFLIQYMLFLIDDTSNPELAAIIIPALVFGVIHRYQGWWAVIKISTIAALLGVIYIYSKSIFLVIVIHILIDLISGFAGMLYFKRYPLQSRNEVDENN